MVEQVEGVGTEGGGDVTEVNVGDERDEAIVGVGEVVGEFGLEENLGYPEVE